MDTQINTEAGTVGEIQGDQDNNIPRGHREALIDIQTGDRHGQTRRHIHAQAQRQRHIHTQTQKQADKRTGRQAGRLAEKYADIQQARRTYTHWQTARDREAERQITDTEREIHRHRQTHTNIDKDTFTDSQSHKPTAMHTYKHGHTLKLQNIAVQRLTYHVLLCFSPLHVYSVRNHTWYNTPMHLHGVTREVQ